MHFNTDSPSWLSLLPLQKSYLLFFSISAKTKKSRLRQKTETTEGVIERTLRTNLSYSIIPCRAANTKLPAAVRYGNKTVFLFLSEFSNCSVNINCEDAAFIIRYFPTWIDGKKHARNVYAHTREEREEKLKVLIAEMKAELAELKRQKGDRH